MLKNILVLSIVFSFTVLVLLAFQKKLPLLSFNKTTGIVRSQPTELAKTNNSGVQKINDIEIERLNLQKELQAEFDAIGTPNDVGFYYKNINGAYEIEINADRPFNPASTAKAFVVVEAFRQRRSGLVNFDSRVTIKKENVVPNELETADYQPLRAGVKATIRELVEAMITQSDNTAFNTLIDVLDRRNITITLRKLGLEASVVGEKLNLSDEQFSADASVTGRQQNRTTARDFGRLFTLLYEGKIDDSEEMLAIFKKQKYNDMIPKLLPTEIKIAHKTGFSSPNFHDGGIVYKPGDPFTLAIFTSENDPNIVARFAKICYFKSRDVLGENTTSRYGQFQEFIDQIKNLVKIN